MDLWHQPILLGKIYTHTRNNVQLFNNFTKLVLLMSSCCAATLACWNVWFRHLWPILCMLRHGLSTMALKYFQITRILVLIPSNTLVLNSTSAPLNADFHNIHIINFIQEKKSHSELLHTLSVLGTRRWPSTKQLELCICLDYLGEMKKFLSDFIPLFLEKSLSKSHSCSSRRHRHSLQNS